jgi:26S proteasome regulatory subunit N8
VSKIDELMRRFCPNPVFVLIDVRPDVEGIPTTAYVSVEEVETVSMNDETHVIYCLHPYPLDKILKKYSIQIYVHLLKDGKEIQRSFKHIPSSVGAFEAEEVI